jgi:hypothetical protein
MATTDVERYLQELQAVQREIIEELTDLDRAELRYATDHWRWNTLRRVLLRFGDHLREHTTQLIAAREAVGAEQTMPQRMLAQAQESYGRLLGAMVGLEDDDLDKTPEAGEWTPRQVLEHMIETQHGYLGMIRRAQEKAEPVEKD